MDCRYDFHIHSCLSPCGEREMTPNNIAGMAKVLELDIIALTDHNSAGNCRSVIEAAKPLGLTVVPGMELCTAEEIHVVCLFAELEKAEEFSDYVKSTMPPVKNDIEVFGEQLYLDANDEMTGSEEILLTLASNISIDDVPKLVAEYGGFCYPAHIDRPSYSLLATFGMIDESMGFSCAELTPFADLDKLTAQHPALEKMRIMRSSDAHCLEVMAAAEQGSIKLERLSAKAVIEALRNTTKAE